MGTLTFMQDDLLMAAYKTMVLLLRKYQIIQHYKYLLFTYHMPDTEQHLSVQEN